MGARRIRGAVSALLVVIGSAAGCSTRGGAPDDWSRSYLSTPERVFAAALDALEDSGFYLDEVDEASGRIRAESSVRRGDEVTLFVDVAKRRDRIRVDVMASSASAREGAGPGPMTAVVREFLSALDARLEGRVD